MTQSRTALITAAAILLATFCAGVSGQAPAPGPGSPEVAPGLGSPEAAPGPAGGDVAMGPAPDCMTYLVNASDCLSFVTSDSKLAKPDKACCPELAGLVDSNPICLCYLLGGQNSFGIEIDMKKALKLPSICSVTTPPVSLCSAIGIPVGAPTSSSVGMAPTSTSPSMSMPPDAGLAPVAAMPSATLSEATCNARNALSLFIGLGIAFVSVMSL